MTALRRAVATLLGAGLICLLIGTWTSTQSTSDKWVVTGLILGLTGFLCGVAKL